jgi:hypothetical protein
MHFFLLGVEIVLRSVRVIVSLFHLFCFQKKWQQASTVLLPLPSPFLWQRYGTVDLERQSLHVVAV